MTTENRPEAADEDISWGAYLTFPSADMVEFLGCYGFQWIFLDHQHGAFPPAFCRDLLRAVSLDDMECFVRIHKADEELITQYLEAGVNGFFAPNISSAEQARAFTEAVAAVHSSSSRSRRMKYGFSQHLSNPLPEEPPAATIALIESEAGINALEEILSVPGIEYAAIGTGDLRISMGIPPGKSDPRLTKIVGTFRARMKDHGVQEIAVVSNRQQAAAAIEAGVQRIAIPETAMITAGAERIVGRKLFE